MGGIYTALHVKELKLQLDVGIPLRSHARAEHIFVSHGHADHAGSLGSLLAIRGLMGRRPPRVFLPQEAAESVSESLKAMSRAHRWDLEMDCEPCRAGDVFELKTGLWARAFRTHHPCPSLGYQFFRRVDKLRAEYLSLPGPEIALRKGRGEDLFFPEEHLELAYATDTLIRVLDSHPSLLRTKVLILECSFLDERKKLTASRAGGHIHLDELLERADEFDNEVLVLMHFSQIYSPERVRRIIKRRCPAHLFERIVLFAPKTGDWPG